MSDICEVKIKFDTNGRIVFEVDGEEYFGDSKYEDTAAENVLRYLDRNIVRLVTNRAAIKNFCQSEWNIKVKE